MHRICSHLSLRLLLPPSQRDLWDILEKERKELDPIKSKEMYKSDPFVSDNKEGSLARKDSSKHVSRDSISSKDSLKSSSKSSSSLLKRTLPTVHLSSDLRQFVESLIRTFGTSFSKSKSKSIETNETNENNQPRDDSKSINSLVKKGFRQAHVQEASEYCDSMSQMLHWLLIHVPEDDLPEQFMHKTSREIRLQQHDQESLKLDYILKRLMSTGISFKYCQEALEKANGNEFESVGVLTTMVYESLTSEPWNIPIEMGFDLEMERDQEVETCTSIYQEGFHQDIQENGRVWTIVCCNQMSLILYIPHSSTYPFLKTWLVIFGVARHRSDWAIADTFRRPFFWGGGGGV